MGKVGTQFKATLNSKFTYQITAVLCYDYCDYVVFNDKDSVVAAGRFSISDDASVAKGLKDSGILDVKISKFILSSTLAPVNFVKGKDFKKSKLNSYLMGVYPKDKLISRSLKSSKMKGQKLYVVYGVPKNILARFQEVLPKLKLTHLSEGMCNYGQKNKHNGTLALIGDGYLAISCHKKGASYFYNKFDCFGESDVLYYLSLVFEILELDASKEIVWIGGEILEDGKLAQSLKATFKKLKWLTGFSRYTKKAPNTGAYYAPHMLIKL